MKVLLDECLPKDLCKSLPGHDCHAARRAGFGGRKNGELLLSAEKSGFDVLITVDKNMPHQQNLSATNIALLILNAPSNRLEHLAPLMPKCLSALALIRPGQVVRLRA